MKRPFLYIALAFAFGIAYARLAHPAFMPVLWAACIALGICVAGIRRRVIAHLALYAALFFCGAAAYAQSQVLPVGHISSFAPEKPAKVFLQGVVVDDPAVETSFYRKEKKSFILEATAYRRTAADAWRPVRGLVRVNQYFTKAKPLEYGDIVAAEGHLYRPAGLRNPGLFDYARYLADHGIYAAFTVRDNYVLAVVGKGGTNPVTKFAYRARAALRHAIDRYLEYPANAFIKAIMIGDRSDLPERITDDFIKSGTVHILAVSGLNLGIIAVIILFVFGALRIPRKAGLALTVAAVGVYAVTAGSSPPVVRAAIIFAIVAAGRLIRRDTDSLNALGIAAFAMLAYDPRVLFDAGFQLSFGSIASIIILTPRIERLIGADRITRDSIAARAAYYLATGIVVSVAAWAGTWPVVAAYFNITSPISVIANLVIVPAIFVLTVAASAFLAAAFLWPAAAPVCAIACQALSQAIFISSRVFAGVPGGYAHLGKPGAPFCLVYYLILATLWMPAVVFFRGIAVRRRTVMAGLLAALTVMVWHGVFAPDLQRLSVAFLDVGQGDAAVIRWPGGTALVDGGTGGAEEKLDAGKSIVAPYLWNSGVRRVDVIVVTHFHDDHLGGLIYVLENFDVGMVVDNGAELLESPLYGRYIGLLKERGVTRAIVGEGDMIRMGGAQLFFMNPVKGKDILRQNEDSLVGKFVAPRVSVLFFGDVQEEGIARLASYGAFLHADIIKVPHHGSSLGSYETVKDFFELIGPRAAVTSVARINRYNAPSQNVVNALTDCGIYSYMTKDDGAVIVTEKDGFVLISTVSGKKLAF